MKSCVATLLLAATLLTGNIEAASKIYLADSVANESTHPPLRAQARELAAIFEELKRVSGVEATLLYSTDPQLNAFATESDGQKLVLVQAGLLEDFDHDRDAVAAVLGHELAHHKADHIRAGHRKQQNVRVLGAILGAVAGAKLGRDSGVLAGAAGNAAINAGAHLLALKFNRSQELQADRLAVEWMIAAGFNPLGMLRLQQRLGEAAGKQRNASILNTHPASNKRLQAARKRIAELAPPAELLASEARPLVDEAGLALANAEIEQARTERIVAALQSRQTVPPEEAMTPVQGIDLDTYAALSNQLLLRGASGKSAVLAEHGLDESAYAHLSRDYTLRMSSYPGLREQYDARFFRASHGRFADWGRDLGESYAEAKPLKLDPPYPLEAAAALFAEQRARGGHYMTQAQLDEFEREVLAPHGMRYYDFLIAHNWWVRKGAIAAIGGDNSVNRALLTGSVPIAAAAASHPASEESVRSGSNVKVGEGVQVQGKAVAADRASDGEGRR